jgi:hypothetical protein
MERGRTAVALGLPGEEGPRTGRPLPNARRFFRVRVCGRTADFWLARQGKARQGKARWCPILANLADSRTERAVDRAGGAGRLALTSWRRDVPTF